MRRLIGFALSGFLIASTCAQSPAPSPPVSPSPAATATTKPAKPTPTPVTPSTHDLVSSLGEADLQAAITLFKNNFTNPDAINETELNRATLEGLILRHPRGLMLIPGRDSPPPMQAACYAEIFEGHIGYLRPGAMISTNLKASDRKLAEFSSKKVDAIILDLRDSLGSTNFEIAAEFAKRFCPKGKLLFTLHRPGARQDRAFTSDRDPSFQGLTVVLADHDTEGGAEVFGAVLRFFDRALIVGQPTAGRAVEYADFPLPNGQLLRVAAAETILPGGQSLFPDGVKPDLPVEMPPLEKRQIFQASADRGMGPFVYEAQHPHLNEAALLAGTNPELEAAEAQRRSRNREKLPARDLVLQRALDLVTSLEILQKR
jgi:Peptidase family S41